MSDIFFWSWQACQLFFLLYIAVKNKTLFNAYSLVTAVYFGSYAYPYLYTLGYIDTIFSNNESLFNSEFSNEAIWSFFWFKLAIDIFYILCTVTRAIKAKPANLSLNPKMILRTKSFYKRVNIYFILTSYFICLIGFVIGAGGFNKFLFPDTRFNFDNTILVNASNIISILVYFYSLMRHYNYRPNLPIVIIGTIFVLIYPMSLSGRAVVLPFVMLLVASYFSEKGLSLFRALILSVIISAFYVNALYVRNTGIGIDKFIDGFAITYTDIPFLIDYFFATVSGFTTVTVTLSGLYDGTISLDHNYLLFLLYISPIPSIFLPTESFVPYQSLTAHFGFSIGINADIVSESMLWFGKYGVLLTGSIMGVLVRYVDIVTRNKDMVAKLLFFSMIYLVLMSNIASIRASSRLVVIVLTFVLIRWTLKKLSHAIK